MNALRLLPLVVSLAVLAGCQKAADTKPAEKDKGDMKGMDMKGMEGMDHSKMKDTEKPTGTPAEKEYDIKGKVVDVAGDMKAVTLDHEEIPGLMKAMKMKYAVDDHKILEGIKAGDNVKGRLKAKGTSYTITKLEKH